MYPFIRRVDRPKAAKLTVRGENIALLTCAGRCNFLLRSNSGGTMDVATRVRLPLLLLRIGVFIVMLMWALDKFVRPGHAAGVYKKFYQLDLGGPTLFYVLGGLELVLLALFVSGTAKRFSYGAVLLLHAVSTVSSYRQYLGFDNLLFFAAWPMLAACAALYLLRDLDTLWALEKTPAAHQASPRAG